MFEIKLYVTGQTPNSEKAIQNLKAFLEEEFSGQYSLDIVDILRNPESGEEDKIFVTPTVVRCRPEPCRRVIGDLSDKAKVFEILGLKKP